jgi:hypothetical protein
LTFFVKCKKRLFGHYLVLADARPASGRLLLTPKGWLRAVARHCSLTLARPPAGCC